MTEIKELTDKYNHTLRNAKMLAKKSEQTRGQMENEIRSLQERVAELEDVIAQTEREASEVPKRAVSQPLNLPHISTQNFLKLPPFPLPVTERIN